MGIKKYIYIQSGKFPDKILIMFLNPRSNYLNKQSKNKNKNKNVNKILNKNSI